MKICYWPIGDLPGIAPEYVTALTALGIADTKRLLERTPTRADRIALAATLKVHLQYVNKWSALADLARLPDVGCKYCGLLLHSGIASIEQLATIPIYHLQRQVTRLQVSYLGNNELCPPAGLIQKWSEGAKIFGSISVSRSADR